jgi:dynactin 1
VQPTSRPSPSKLGAPPPPASPTKRSPPSGLQLRKPQIRPQSDAPQSPIETSSRPIGIANHRRKSSLSTKPQIATPTPPTPNNPPIFLPSTSPASQPERPHSPHVDTLPEPPRPRPVSPQVQLPRPQDELEIQELRARIRVLEAKRADDARHVRELETRLEQAEAFVALKPKLQAKLTEQRTDLIAAQSELAEAKQLAALNESRVVDAQETLEMAMLDKEVAEERVELAEAELEELRERLAIAEIELEVLKEEKESVLSGQLGTGVEGDVKNSLAYIQLEKQNERLKDALLRYVEPNVEPSLFNTSPACET